MSLGSAAADASIGHRRVVRTFAALVAVQAAHSVEEYVFRLYDVFPPARILSGLVSDDRALGFLRINVTLGAFGVWCVAWPVRRAWRSAPVFLGIWIGIEVVNGIGHPLWSGMQGGYTPGVATAPLLLVLALVLARRMASSGRSPRGG